MLANLVQLLTAFVGGVASFLSPCVLPLVPAYISYLSAQGLGENEEAGAAASLRGKAVRHGLAFILGFSLVFLTLGASASALGAMFYDFRFYLARIGGLLVILFGLHMAGILRIPFLNYEWKPGDASEVQGRGYWASFLMGVFFSAGWSPCVGPVLGAILTLTLQQGALSWGMVLLAVYSMGLAIPFLAAAWSLDWVLALIQKYRKVSHWAERSMGVILIFMGLLLVSGRLARLSTVQTWSDLWRILR